MIVNNSRGARFALIEDEIGAKRGGNGIAFGFAGVFCLYLVFV